MKKRFLIHKFVFCKIFFLYYCIKIVLELEKIIWPHVSKVKVSNLIHRKLFNLQLN